MSDETLAELVVRRIDDRSEVARVQLTNLSDGHVERTMMGMLRNMGEDYFIDDSEVDEARAQPQHKVIRR